MNKIGLLISNMHNKVDAVAQKETRHPLLLHTFLFLLMPLLLLALLEIMHLTNGFAFISFFSSPYFVVKLLISYVFILSVQWLLWCFMQHTPTAVLVNYILFLALGFVTEVMISITGDPLLPTDILLAGQLNNITSFVRIPIVPFALVSVIAAVFVCSCYLVWHKRAVKVKMKIWQRILCIALGVSLSCVTLYAVCMDYDFRHGTLKKLDVQIAAFNPVDDYRKNGLILEFFPRIGDMFVEKMDGYSENKMEIVTTAFADDRIFTEREVHPNIIYIQSEALWDVYDMKQTEFNVDPMRNIRKIAKERNGYMGKLVTSVFGGGTCLPEFEALTGLNCRYLLSNGYPYVQYITSETPSIVSAFRDNGYSTVAFHPYHKNFYSRNRAYPMLGFDAFYGMEDMEEASKSGWYVSDNAVTEFIIDTYENKQADQPLFMFTVTMQNHGGYSPARYETYNMRIKNDGLGEAETAELLDFAQGVYEADRAFAKLVEYFRHVDEPTIIVMYGDHLPLLGVEGKIYREGGYVENTLPFVSNRHEKLHETPYVVWANYNINLGGFNKKISAGKVGLEVLKLGGLKEVPAYFDTLYTFYRELPVVSPYCIYDARGRKLENIPENMSLTEKAFKYIQYDLLHGKRYVREQKELTE